jgi:hypothetical protein
MRTPPKRQTIQDSGFALVAVFIVLIPMLVLVGAITTEITARNSELRVELDQEMALLAAESGVDDAIYRGRIGELKDGDVYSREIGRGQSFQTTATYLKTDGKDNDDDGKIDEDDEDVFQVIVAGTYRHATRRVVAYLGPVPLLPKLDAALATQDPNIQITLQGSPLISGFNKRIDGSPGTGPAVPGLAIAPPGTVATLSAQLTGTEPTKVEGVGGTPSLDTTGLIDVAALVDQARNIANEVLTTDMYTTHTFGDASAGTAQVTFREGNVKFTGNSRGAGVLVVTGNLEMVGTFRFDGVIIVLGKITNSAGTAKVYGSILQGPKGTSVMLKGTADIQYSEEAIAIANSASGTYVAFNGWQEIGR